MAMIGEELMALLGMIPVRDQAGIPRGNLAQETAANAARMKATLEPQPDQMPVRGLPIATPPDVTLPGDAPVSYASAKSPVTTAIPPNAHAVQNALPNSPLPEPDEARTIATAPSNALTQLDQQIARREQMSQMNSVLSGLQLLTNSFNRDPESRSTNQNSILAGMGSGGLDVKDITDIYKTRELLQKADEDRRAAAQAVQLRERMIQDLMDRRGWSRARAEGQIASGAAKDAYDQDKNKAYYEDQLKEKTRQKILGDPELLKAHAAQAGLPVEVFRTQLERGEVLGSKDLSEIGERTQKTTITGADFGVRSEGMKNPEAIAARLSARLGRTVDPDEVRLAAATEETWKDFVKQTTEGGQTDIRSKALTAAKTRQEVAREAGQAMSYEDAQADPGAFARRYDLSPSAVERATANRPAYEKFTADRSGATTASVQGFEYDRARAREGGPEALRAFDTKYPDLPTYERLKIPSTIEGPEEKARTELMTGRAKRFVEKDEPAAREIEKTISIANHTAQQLWDEALITGGGQYSVAEEKGRRLAAKYLGYGDDAVQSTQLFFNARKADALKMRGTDMPGAMSDADREFLLEIAGNRDMSAQTLKRLLMIQEKYQRALLENHNAEVRRLKAANPKAYADVQEIAQPKLGRFHEEALATPKMQALLKGMRENPDNERLRTRFNEEMGATMADRYAPREPRP